MKEITNEVKYVSVSEDENTIIYNAVSTRTVRTCPYCNRQSTKKHSKFYRNIQDLPENGKTVYIRLENYIMKCVNPECEYNTFSEEFSFAPLKTKYTDRLIKHIVEVGNTAVCRKAAKILNDEGIVVAKTCVNKLVLKNKNGQ